MSVIRVEGLTKSYGSIIALDDLSFNVEKGTIYGFLGPNGAGKSTTIGIMMQFIFADKGEVFIFDKDVSTEIVEIKKKTGLIPDANPPEVRAINLLNHTGRFAGFQGSELRSRIDEAVQIIGGNSFIRQNTRNMSKGQRQRVKIANALISNPELIIADEPSAGLDPLSRKQILSLFEELKKEGKTIFFSNHVISEVEKIADKVLLLSKGKNVLEGSIASILDSLPVSNSYVVGVEGMDRKDIEILTGIESVRDYSLGRYLVTTSNEERNPKFLEEILYNSNSKLLHFSTQTLELEDMLLEAINNES